MSGDAAMNSNLQELVTTALRLGFKFIAFRKDEMVKAMIFAADEDAADDLVETYVDGECCVALSEERH